VGSIYPNLRERCRKREALEERAILRSRNEKVREIKDYIMDQLEGEEKTYLSCGTVCKATTLNGETDMLCPTEFLNSLTFPGIPSYELN
jgi:ATP-dependent DNA helicase PIF1